MHAAATCLRSSSPATDAAMVIQRASTARAQRSTTNRKLLQPPETRTPAAPAAPAAARRRRPAARSGRGRGGAGRGGGHAQVPVRGRAPRERPRARSRPGTCGASAPWLPRRTAAGTRACSTTRPRAGLTRPLADLVRALRAWPHAVSLRTAPGSVARVGSVLQPEKVSQHVHVESSVLEKA